MVDRPIIFSAPMVLALLAGRKTQTRRLASSPLAKVQPGDRLWVRENFGTSDAYSDAAILGVEYAADGTTLAYANGELHQKEHGCAQYTGPWKPSIHMPRWASRITLVVEEVRVQPLQDITESDAIAEGVVWSDQWSGFVVPGVEHPINEFPVLSRPTAREMYAALWDSLHGSGQWLGNPAIVALTFRVVRSNIDALMQEAA